MRLTAAATAEHVHLAACIRRPQWLGYSLDVTVIPICGPPFLTAPNALDFEGAKQARCATVTQPAHFEPSGRPAGL
jgi:hypothetical protein